MSFGYGISDFLALSKLAWEVFQNSSKACGAHTDLTREAKSLHTVLQRLELEVASPESLLNRKTDNRREELDTLCSDCNCVLRVLQKILEKYNALSEEERSLKKLWQKIRFGNGEMQDLNELRFKLTTSTQALSLFLNMLSIGSQGKVEQYMNSQGPELKEIKTSVNWIAAMLQAKSPGEGSILTTYTNDDKLFWKEFRRELVKEGFPSSVIKKHRKVITEYVMEIGNRGALDDVEAAEDSVLPENTLSAEKTEVLVLKKDEAVSGEGEEEAVSREASPNINAKEPLPNDKQNSEQRDDDEDEDKPAMNENAFLFNEQLGSEDNVVSSAQSGKMTTALRANAPIINSLVTNNDGSPEESYVFGESSKAREALVGVKEVAGESGQNTKIEPRIAEQKGPPVQKSPWSEWAWCEEGSITWDQMVYRGRKDSKGEWEYEFADLDEAYRLNFMQALIPAEQPEQRPNRLRRPRPKNYDDEIERRRQERADEELARRLQRVSMEDGDDDYKGGRGDIHGIGDGRFMNQDYIRAAHNILTGNLDRATAAANHVAGASQARRAPSRPRPRSLADRYPAPQRARPRPPTPPLVIRK